MKKIISLKKKYPNFIFVIHSFFWGLASACLISEKIGFLLSFCFFTIFSCLLYFPVKNYVSNNDLLFDFRIFFYVFIVSISFSFLFLSFFLKSFQEYLIQYWFFILSFSAFLLPFVEKLYNLSINSFVNKKERIVFKKRIFYNSPFFVFFIFIFFIQPLDLYFHNCKEIPFGLIDIFRSLLYYLSFLFIFLFIINLLPDIQIKLFCYIFSSVNIAMYIQLIFFNNYVNEVMGEKYDWNKHFYYSVIDFVVWILIFLLPFFSLFIKKLKQKILDIYIYLNILIFLMLLSGLAFSFIFSLDSIRIKNDKVSSYLDSEEQFTVGDENVIYLVADAIDNNYIKQILADDAEFFDEFNDFTLYTDTCSIYETTANSVPQIIFGYTFNGDFTRMNSFMERLVNNGFRILLFNYDAIGIGNDCTHYISNYGYSSKAIYVRDEMVREYLFSITMYQLLPCIFKSFSCVEKVNFDLCIDDNPRYTSGIKYANREFRESLMLTKNPYSNKCFIYQHINGAHVPSDDFIADTKYSLENFKKYIYQMKKMDCYDSSVIIIASDHGARILDTPSASTPMFLIKKKNEKHDKIVISDKPMYYQDIQATVLKSANLYFDGDDEVFGKSIDDYNEVCRTRVWFYSFDSKIRKYTYTGDTKELEKCVNNNNFEIVDDYSFDFNDYIEHK